MSINSQLRYIRSDLACILKDVDRIGSMVEEIEGEYCDAVNKKEKMGSKLEAEVERLEARAEELLAAAEKTEATDGKMS